MSECSASPGRAARPPWRRGATGTLLAVLLCCCARHEAATVAPGPVVFIVVDTLRADHLTCFGYQRETSPGMCSLREDGVQFSHAYTTLTYTTPAIASMLTGLYPNRHGLRSLYLLLPRQRTTLAEVFAAHGYRTGAFVSSFAMVRDFSGFDQGFGVYEDYVQTKEPFRINYERPAKQTVDLALDWFEDAGPEAFLFLHLIEPHGPYTPPEPYLRRFALPAAGAKAPPESMIPEYQRIPGLSHVSEFVGRYDGEIRAVDDQIARVLNHLRQRNWYDGAMIVLVADHGESMGEEGVWFSHGESVHDAEANVPLLIKWPRNDHAPHGENVDTPVSVVDLFPTVLQAARIDTEPYPSQGVDLRPIADGGERPNPIPATIRNLGDGLVVAAHGRRCSVRWSFVPPALDSGFLLANGASASGWPTVAATTTALPEGASPACTTDVAGAVTPLMTDLLTYRLDVPVLSRHDAKDPDTRRRFVAARSRHTLPLTDGEREALRSLGYLE